MPTPKPIPPEQIALYNKIKAKLPPATLAKLQSIQPGVEAKLKSDPNADPQQVATQAIQNMGALPPGGDISELCFVVLMNATNDQDKDLQTIMAQTQAQTAAKQKLRDQMNTVNKNVAANAASSAQSTPTAGPGALRPNASQAVHSGSSVTQMQTTQNTSAGNQTDSMNEMSEMTSMRLQMAMDRRSKFVEALSNIMKKINDTQSTMTQNMK